MKRVCIKCDMTLMHFMQISATNFHSFRFLRAHCAKSSLYTFEALAYNRYDDVLLSVEVSCHAIPFHRVDHVLLHYYNHILCKICLLHLMWDELLVFYGCIHEICWECDGKRHREGVVLWEINKIGFYVLKMIIKVNLLSQKARSYYAIHVLKP